MAQLHSQLDFCPRDFLQVSTTFSQPSNPSDPLFPTLKMKEATSDSP
jgi:hypothetical protein